MSPQRSLICLVPVITCFPVVFRSVWHQTGQKCANDKSGYHDYLATWGISHYTDDCIVSGKSSTDIYMYFSVIYILKMFTS